MYSNDLKIIVAGDVTVDWYFWTRSSNSDIRTETINWKLYDGLNMRYQLAGAILLSKILKEIYPENCIRDQMPGDFNDLESKSISLLIDPSMILHTNMRLDLFPSSKSNSKDKVYRVKTYFGVTTPEKNIDAPDQFYPKPLGIVKDDKDADLVVIHDIGNGFRDNDDVWPEAIKNDKKPTIIHYMNLPLFKGELWKHLIKYHKQNVILVLNAEDLRQLGANISRSISWEKTALDFLWEVNNNKELADIKGFPNVIVRFGLEGAIHYKVTDGIVSSKLYFDPYTVEEGFWDSKKLGSMKGISAVFVSSLASKIISSSKEKNVSDKALKDGIEFGLLKSREFLKNGHGYDSKNGIKKKGPIFFNEIYKDLFKKNYLMTDSKRETDHIECMELPPVHRFKNPDPNFWSILEEKTIDGNKNLLEVATKIVKEGKPAFSNFPVGYFGKLTTVDRAEIESYRSVMSIMEEYINSEKTTRPLSIAVFGSPGSGKSFGITQVAKTIDAENVKKIVFNVSQFTSITDLSSAFHRVRDISLKGKIPLVFFDEFDCTFDKQPLGWLRYFLVPMQDGEFIDQGNVHPIGRSIFVFAGGVYKDFQQFCDNIGVNLKRREKLNGNQNLVYNESLPEKCPDFVSRLRGYVNILGPNKISINDSAYIIRRAVMLRSLIEEKAPYIITNKRESDDKESDQRVEGVANVDDNLLEYLLTVKEYKHGARSMEAIIDMSVLRKHKSWEKASLPPKDQRELHLVEEDLF